MDRYEAYERARALADEGQSASQIAKSFISHGVQVDGTLPKTWTTEDVEQLLAAPPEPPRAASATPMELPGSMAADLREIRRSSAVTAFWTRLIGITVLIWIALSLLGAIWFAVELDEEWHADSYSSVALVARR